MIDKRQQIIKERIQKFAMDLWNIADPRQVDPVIDLILDAIAVDFIKALTIQTQAFCSVWRVC